MTPIDTDDIDKIVVKYRAEKKTISRSVAHKMLKRDIANQVKQARIDELHKIHPHINRNLGNFTAYLNRIAELENK